MRVTFEPEYCQDWQIVPENILIPLKGKQLNKKKDALPAFWLTLNQSWLPNPISFPEGLVRTFANLPGLTQVFSVLTLQHPVFV